MNNSEKQFIECEALYSQFLALNKRKPKPEELAQLLMEQGKSGSIISAYLQRSLTSTPQETAL